MRKEYDYTALDRPDVSHRLFHPRPEPSHRKSDANRFDLMIPVGNKAAVGASFHKAGQAAPILLFFHGNGEIVPDYDDMAAMFTGLGVNFFVADYRGYGRSTGAPSVSAMMSDCHKVMDFLGHYRVEHHLTGPVCLMGRSLGSASVLELAWKRSDEITCLIIESGFAFAGPLLRLLGIDPDRIGFREEEGFDNIHKVRCVRLPCLVIHAQNDHIIPFFDGQALYEACPSKDKELLEIKGANHNDLFFKGMGPYLSAVKKFCVKKP